MFVRQPARVVLACLVFFTVAYAQAAAYKCVSPQGGTEYIDLPKEGYTCTPVRTVPPPTPVSDQAESSAKSNASEDSDGAAQDANEANARQANCETARSNLALLQGEQDVVITDKDGNKTLLNAEQRQVELNKAQKDVDYWCSAE